jgi:mono/diheme cytochrome c family protein
MKFLALAVCPLFIISIAKAQDDVPDGPGKDVVQRVCAACHDLGPLGAINGNKDTWQGVVDDMRGRGADGTDDDFKTIVNYLSKYLGVTVNVNSATADVMATEFGITPAESAAIVKYRTDKGNIKDWDTLSKVPGLDASKIAPLKKRIKY